MDNVEAVLPEVYEFESRHRHPISTVENSLLAVALLLKMTYIMVSLRKKTRDLELGIIDEEALPSECRKPKHRRIKSHGELAKFLIVCPHASVDLQPNDGPNCRYEGKMQW